MTINAAGAASFAAATSTHASSADVVKLSAKQPQAQNDADGDLKADLASGESRSAALGSNVNVKA